MDQIFSVQDRAAAFDYVLSAARSCRRIISLVQAGSGAQGYHDEWSELDFVAALDSGDAMAEVMAYMHRRYPGNTGFCFSVRMSPGISSVFSCPISWRSISDTAPVNTRPHGSRPFGFCTITPAWWRKRWSGPGRGWMTGFTARSRGRTLTQPAALYGSGCGHSPRSGFPRSGRDGICPETVH